MPELLNYEIPRVYSASDIGALGLGRVFIRSAGLSNEH